MTNAKRLCLNMIVKNEMANLERCLNADIDRHPPRVRRFRRPGLRQFSRSRLRQLLQPLRHLDRRILPAPLTLQ